MAQSSNTMIFADRPADINALLAQASAVVKAVSPQDNHNHTGGSDKHADKRPFNVHNL
jgi:hypothetical protein